MILIRNILVVLGVMALALFGLIWSARHFGVDGPNMAGHRDGGPDTDAPSAPVTDRAVTGLVWHESAMYRQGCFRFALSPADEGRWRLEGCCYNAAADGAAEVAGASVSAEDWQVVRTIVESMALAPYVAPAPDAPVALDAPTGKFVLEFSDGSSTRYALPEYDEAREALLATLTELVMAGHA